MVVNEDILTGLRNALSRGENIQKAMQSMISAGYNVQEVQEAIRYVNMGTINIPNQEINKSQSQIIPEPPLQTQQINQPSQNAPIQQIQEQPQKIKKKFPVGLTILIILLVLLIAGLSLLIIFGESILNFLYP